jgi:cyclophilin family peptidyl-prolyl cis-trans isomerase
MLLLLACGEKKATTIDPQKVADELARYGQSNPETEVQIETPFGNMKIKLYSETPLHRANFIKNIKEGIYDDAEFYRVYRQFMIQGGIYPKELQYTVPAEFNRNYIHKKGAVSMARSDENNPGRESSSTEFFIVQGSKYTEYQVEDEMQNLGLTLTDGQKQAYMTTGGYMSLDQQYTTFGEVVEGLDVIDKIAGVKVYNEDKPLRKIPLKIGVIR